MKPRQCKRLRKSVGETQHGLARLAGMPAWRVSHFENGLIDLTAGEVERIKTAIRRASRENVQRVEATLGSPEPGILRVSA